MTSEKEQFYIQRIAELEKQVAELMEQVGKLTDKVAKLSKNSSNSSKPPSSDIVKPEKYSITNNREIAHRIFRFCNSTIFLSSCPHFCITGQ